MNPEEIRALNRQILALKSKGFSPGDIDAWVSEHTQGQYASVGDVTQAVQTLPDNLLRASARLAQRGFKPEDINAWLADHSQGQFPTVQALTEHLGQQRQAQNAKDNPPNLAEKIGQMGAGVGRNFVQGATLNFGDELAGAMSGGNYRQAQQQYEQQASDFAQQHPYVAGAAQTAGMLTGMATAGMLGQPEVSAGYLPGLLKTVAGATAYGNVAGAGEAPTIKDIPSYAAASGTNAGLMGLAAGTVLPAAAIGGGAVLNLFRRLGNNPATLRGLADASVGGALAQDASNGGGIPAIREMQSVGAPLVIGADAGGVSASLVRKAANLNPALRSPIETLIDARQSGRVPALMRNIEQGAQMTQGQARAGAAEAAAAKRALGPAFDAIDAVPLVPESPAAKLISEFRSWAKPEKPVVAPAATMSPDELLVRRQNFKMGVGPNPDLVPADAAPRPYGSLKIGRVVNRALGNVGDRPLSVQHGRAILNALKDAKKAAFEGPARDRSLGPALQEQIDRFTAALESSSPEFQAVNTEYRKAIIAQDAFKMGAKARTAGDATQSLADRHMAIQSGAPETALRYKQGMLSDLLRTLGQSHPATPGPAVKQVSAFADATRQAAGEPHPVRDLYRTIFPTKQGLNLVDRGVKAANAQNYVDNVMHAGSTTAGQLGDIGNDYSVRSAKDIASPSWERMASSLIRDAIDKMTAPGTRKAAAMAANSLMQPATPEVQQNLFRLLQLGRLNRTEQKALQALLVRGGGLFGMMAGQDTGRP